MRHDKFLFPVIFAVIAAVAIGFDGFYTVGEQEQAVISSRGLLSVRKSPDGFL